MSSCLLHPVVLMGRQPAADLQRHGEDDEIEPMDIEYALERAGRAMWGRTLGRVFGYPRFLAKASWLRSPVHAVVVGLVFYAASAVFLAIPPPPGLLR